MPSVLYQTCSVCSYVLIIYMSGTMKMNVCMEQLCSAVSDMSLSACRRWHCLNYSFVHLLIQIKSDISRLSYSDRDDRESEESRHKAEKKQRQHNLTVWGEIRCFRGGGNKVCKLLLISTAALHHIPSQAPTSSLNTFITSWVLTDAMHCWRVIHQPIDNYYQSINQSINPGAVLECQNGGMEGPWR